MKTLVTIALCGVLTLAVAPASVKSLRECADHTAKKASSFAPRPGGSKQHVYGAPIQSPIFRMRPKMNPHPSSSPSKPA